MFPLYVGCHLLHNANYEKKFCNMMWQSPEYTHNLVKQNAISHGNILGSSTAVQ